MLKKKISSNYSESRKWEGFTKFIESKNIFLLFSDEQVDIIPKRAFTTVEQLDLFRILLNKKIKNIS
ncbi:MAG: YcxB family protein [Waterburya sp.]